MSENTIEIDPELVQLINEIEQYMDIDKTAILTRAINLLSEIGKYLEKGDKVAILSKDDVIKKYLLSA